MLKAPYQDTFILSINAEIDTETLYNFSDQMGDFCNTSKQVQML